jgi:hypothetical protein
MRRCTGFDAANRECAHIIAVDPAKYPPNSLPAIWAAAILAGNGREKELPLFLRTA